MQKQAYDSRVYGIVLVCGLNDSYSKLKNTISNDAQDNMTTLLLLLLLVLL